MEIRRRPVGPFQMNAYIVFDEASRVGVVVDPGDGVDELLEEIRRERLDIRLILLTHGHIDHVAYAQDMHEALEVPMLLHKDDHAMAVAAPQQAAMFGLPPCRVPVIDGELAQGQVVEAGPLRFAVRHAPGHSPGSVILVAPGAALVGDVIFAGSIGRTDLPGGDHQTLMDSIWNQVVPLGKDVRLYPGHGPDTTVGEELASNPFLQQRRPSGRSSG